MAVKDKVLVWFMQNILIPKSELIDKPGFIILKMTAEKENVTLREILIAEKLLSNLEKVFSEKYGLDGQKALYSIGKKFGYRYGYISKYPTIKNSSIEKINEFLYFYLRYMEAASFAKNIEFKTDFSNKIYTMKMDQYIVCNLNGVGHILTSGGSAGLWAYIQQDYSFEAVQISCSGKGDKNCEVICATPEYFTSHGINFINTGSVYNCEFNSNYSKINLVRETSFCKKSLKNLIESGFYKFEDSQIKLKSERHALIESNLLYLIETELSSLTGSEKLIKQVGFDFANDLIKQIGSIDIKSFISDYFSTGGFGDVVCFVKDAKYYIKFDFFPWNESLDKVKFILLKGMLSGFIFTKENRVVDFEDPVIDLKFGYLSIIFKEK